MLPEERKLRSEPPHLVRLPDRDDCCVIPSGLRHLATRIMPPPGCKLAGIYVNAPSRAM